mmetsp:Transcript_14664/g.44445  ORF Transcript_14664/g.44445 Transcript_14664/m.44445 type:complete len:300 (-) Transcript_14664:64-963(-)
MPYTPKPELFSSVPLGSQNQVLYMPTPHRALATSGSLSKSGLSKDGPQSGDAISPRSFASTTTASLESERSDIEVLSLSVAVTVAPVLSEPPIFFSVSVSTPNQIWAVRRRYSEFHRLADTLSSHRGLPPKFPPPGRHVPSLVERAGGLAEWATAVLKTQGGHEAVVQFFELDTPFREPPSTFASPVRTPKAAPPPIKATPLAESSTDMVTLATCLVIVAYVAVHSTLLSGGGEPDEVVQAGGSWPGEGWLSLKHDLGCVARAALAHVLYAQSLLNSWRAEAALHDASSGMMSAFSLDA